ncbi:hypothetical protein NS220_13485 [Microbacterium testaceum]|uniref:HTH marR-type domain-containing protein n=1 Tax=Microbacterium testaceum TaxID=2033 RepID=A0A147EUS7_MICTE|nr:hypothetical protein NS220_13485 [Microbacterium testaceum]
MDVMAENGAMPRLTGARDGMPEGAVRAQRVVSTVSRLELARFLRHSPGATRQEIADGSGLTYETVRKEIAHLVQLGYVSIDGQGRNERFTFDGKRYSRDLGQLFGYVGE